VRPVGSYCTGRSRCTVNKTLDSENIAGYPVHYKRDVLGIKGSIKGLQIRLYKGVVYRVTRNLN